MMRKATLTATEHYLVMAKRKAFEHEAQQERTNIPKQVPSDGLYIQLESEMTLTATLVRQFYVELNLAITIFLSEVTSWQTVLADMKTITCHVPHFSCSITHLNIEI